MVSRMEMQQLAEKYGEEARGTDSAAGGARGALTPAAGTWDQSGTPAPADWGSSSEARVAGEKKAAPRLVPFTVTVTLALPLPPVKESNNKKDHKPKTLKILEALKALDYFHVEVSLLPNAEPTIFDLVIFEKAAKLHMANDSQILRLWNENERRWLVFSHNVMLPVTNELLLTLVPHIMTLRIWEGKDKVSPKAKFDHPKNLHHQLEKEGASLGGVRCLVNEQLQLLENSPLLTTSKATDNLPPESINIPVQGTFSTLGLPDIERTMDEQLPGKTCAKPNKPIKIQGAKKHLSVQISKKGSSHKVRAETSKMQDKDKIVSPKMPQNKKKIKEIPVPGLINLDMRFLLAGDKTVTNKLEKLMPGILDAIFTVSMDKSLMSEEMARELNPMIIRITSASSMPSTPIPIHVLQQKCGPVYCQYQFHDLPCHQTKGREQGTEISFKDVNVILTGTINPDKLKEYFLGPPLTIEIHDRDRKLKAQLQPPALFGTEPEDSKLSNVGLVSNKRTVHDPFLDINKSWDPYGIAKLNFSELVHGKTCLNVALCIQNSSLPDPMGYQTDGLDGRILGIAGAIDGPEDRPLPKGHYLESNSMLNVRVQLAYPLTGRSDSASNEIEECPFGRIIYIFHYKNRTFLHSLLEQISSINSLALCLDSQASEKESENGSVDAGFKPDSELKVGSQLDSVLGSNLDNVTGFHVMDGVIHLFVLEGLKNKGLKVLWEKLPVRSVPDEKEKVKVLYNSDFSFHQRLYGKLDDKLYHIYLHEPLSNILKQPLLYVRDMTPQGCFQALHRLQYLCSVEKLREVVQGDLFPTAAMIMVLSREFGIPASESDPRIVKDSPTIPTSLISETPAGKKPSRIPLDIYNKDYMQSKQDRIILTNHIQNNIDAVYEASRKLKETEPRSIKVVLPEGRKVHNYSIQTFNSTEEAKRLLWEMLAKKPKQRFTYSQKFLAGIVTSVDVVSEEKRMKKKSKEAWLTSDGFRFPGFKSSLEANEHPKKPDQARIDELKKPWKENILHGNLNAPLKHQGRWKWNERHKDFELYKQVRYGSSPISILLAGDTLRFEQLESIQKDYKDWYKKMKSYRNTSHSELSITKLENKTKPDKWVTGCLKPTICQKHSDFQHPKD
ncbi:uncharacterized protein cfap92 isoform X2 [Narcine bancroftii]|uniref:uncharacterized protein cfap92 isoform X2 n=1 Tax=Narcine bancroftii TaxID=1343680 RepID=UPI0038319951